MNWFQRPAPTSKEASDPRALRGDGDAIAASVASFLTKTGLFDRDAYVRNNPDAAKASMDPLHHFMRFGIQAGRSFTSVEAIAKLWREALREQETHRQATALSDPARFRVALYVSSLGNFFMSEIAQILLEGFADAGVTAQLLSEKVQPAADATHHIVIAPHEFFVLGEGKRWANDDFVTRAIFFSTEQIQTQWFARSLVFLLRAKAVADMNEQTAFILRKGGVKAVAVQPGFVAGFNPFEVQKTLPPSPVFAGLAPEVRNFDVSTKHFADRPLDVLFLGQASRRREKLLAAYASKFSKLNTFIYCTRTARPLDPRFNPMASSDITASLLQRSKILLNLHRDDYTYFEWWRLMQAFWQKTLVVTEPCFPHPIYKPGIHYLEEAPRHIHHLIDWLAREPEGHAKAEEIRNNAFDTFHTRSTAKSAAVALLQAGEAA